MICHGALDTTSSFVLYIYLFIQLFIHSFVRSFDCSFVRSFVCSFVRSFIHSFVHSFIHTSIHSFIHLSIHSFIQPLLSVHLLCLCIMFDVPFNILYNMLFVYTLFCMLYVCSSVMEDK